mgnify:CR=1 FL=1
MKPIIAPSILSADFGYLAKDIEMVNRSEAEWVHIDIMDGVFVPNISFGFPVLKYVAKLSQKPLDVHLMIVNPEKFIPEVKALGAHTMNVHYEACPHLHRVIQQIREAGMQPAVTSHSCSSFTRYYPGCIYGAYHERESGIWRTEVYRTFSRKSS